MIQGDNQNFCYNIFQEKPIQLFAICDIDCFICSLDNHKLGIYQHGSTQPCGIIIMFFQDDEQWVEYLRKEISSRSLIQFLCFTNNNQQILLHRERTSCIESLYVNQNSELGIISCLHDAFEPFFQFTAVPETMTTSDDQKMILIKTGSKFLLLDVIQKIIIFTSNGYYEQQYYDVNFFDETFFIQTEILEFEELLLEKKIFYNMKNKKAQKFFYLCNPGYYDYQNSADFQQLNNQKSLCYYCFENTSNLTLTILNLTNLKLIRKLFIQKDSILDSHLEFLGCYQRYLLLRLQNNKQNLLHITDLFNFRVQQSDLNYDQFGKEMFAFYNDKQDYIYRKKVLLVVDQNRKKTQFWLTK